MVHTCELNLWKNVSGQTMPYILLGMDLDLGSMWETGVKFNMCDRVISGNFEAKIHQINGYEIN